MELFNRINFALQKNVVNKFKSGGFNLAESIALSVSRQAKKKNGTYNNVLNETLASVPDELKNNTASDNFIYDDELALKHPVKFINRYLNYSTISNAIKTNPNIKRILDECNLSCNFDITNVSSIVMSHLIPTAKKAQKIYKNMGHKASEINYIHLTQAALLHDIGKVFIPKEILNKSTRLTFKERRIIELHNRLSHEILKTTNLHSKVAQLAYEHHNYEEKLKKNEENQALTIADVYCALREKRPYKRPLSDFSARVILYDMGADSKLDSKYISCL